MKLFIQNVSMCNENSILGEYFIFFVLNFCFSITILFFKLTKLMALIWFYKDRFGYPFSSSKSE